MVLNDPSIIQHIKSGNWKKVLIIAKRYPAGLNKEQLREIEIALEGLNGKQSFYKALGIDCLQCFNRAKDILIRKYLPVSGLK